jgi:hypothetical protein
MGVASSCGGDLRAAKREPSGRRLATKGLLDKLFGTL